MAGVLITGCDTGLGREFAFQYAAEGYKVHATYFDLANRIDDDAMHHHPLDVSDAAQFASLAERLDGVPIDILVSNAGIGLDIRKLGELDFDYVQRMFVVNTMGPLRLVETLLANIEAGTQKRIAVVGSRMGSIGLNLTGGHYGYRASKAGLNAIVRSLAIDLGPRGITVVALHPGWVSTGGGSPDAPLTATQSVAAMRSIVGSLGNHETGQFFDTQRTPLPW